jgi:DNA-binding transcriptional regulator GbsR (MarR family)
VLQSKEQKSVLKVFNYIKSTSISYIVSEAAEATGISRSSVSMEGMMSV